MVSLLQISRTVQGHGTQILQLWTWQALLGQGKKCQRHMVNLWKVYGKSMAQWYQIFVHMDNPGNIWIMMDYHGLSWIIIYYHGLSICADYPNKVQIK